jgi:NAD-dependent SIR2 family protein deacetylase
MNEEIFSTKCIACGETVLYIRNENKEFKDCNKCGTLNKRLYERKEGKKTMEIIKGKQILNRRIKEVIWDDPESNISFPQVLTYCEGMGEPLFKITIEKHHEDFFVDEKGQKWVKA